MVRVYWSKRGKRRAAEQEVEATCVTRLCVCEDADTSISAALLFPPPSFGTGHHSACDDRSGRNLLLFQPHDGNPRAAQFQHLVLKFLDTLSFREVLPHDAAQDAVSFAVKDA